MFIDAAYTMYVDYFCLKLNRLIAYDLTLTDYQFNVKRTDCKHIIEEQWSNILLVQMYIP